MAPFRPYFLLTSLLIALSLTGAFRGNAAPPVPLWQPYEQGFEKSAEVRRSGAFGVRCVNATSEEKRGASVTFELNQKKPTTILVSGWSKAENVSGTNNGDYSIYADLWYDDGTPVYGYATAFDTGSHDWQKRRLLITPERPIKRITVYALFRGHSGTSYFDDFALASLSGPQIFDSQALSPPRLPSCVTSGWFVRDVAAGGSLIPLTPGGAASDGLSLSPVTKESDGKILRAALKGDNKRTRAVTLYYVERFDAAKPTWGKTIREAETLTDSEGVNAVTSGSAGATGTHSRYPFGCITSGADKSKPGLAIAIPPDLGPRIARIGYHPGAKLLYIAFDMALMPERTPATIAVARYPVSGVWGFRDAARAYYALFSAYYARRTKKEGIWMPFTSPANVTNVQDFGIAWHEGDTSIASDDKLDILSFRYAEPMSFWMVMPSSESRDYDTALARLKLIAAGEEKTNEEAYRQARAMLTSGSRAANGKYNVEYQNQPWANGAVWTLNPNPRLPGPPDGWNKARVNYDPADADKRYAETAKGTLDGEYLDSMEMWANVLDYGADSLRVSLAPPTFDTDSCLPTLPTWFSVYEFTDYLRSDLHKRGKLLMGNATPWTIYAFAPLLDAAGTETNWLNADGTITPEGDSIQCLRRTLSGRKPYLLLMNTDFDKFPHPAVERYFQRSLFYGIFPSFFSLNAAEHPYWENPKWYNRDRDLFKKYIPILQKLSAAGWEPVTNARSDNHAIYVERYGTAYLTLLNTSSVPAQATIRIEPPLRPGTFATNIITGKRFPVKPASGVASVTLSLSPGEVAALHL